MTLIPITKPGFVTLRRWLIASSIALVSVALVGGGTRPAPRILLGLVIGSAVALAAVHWQASHFKRGEEKLSPRWRRWLGRLELVAFNLCLTGWLAEAVLRGAMLASGASLLTSDTLAAHRLQPGHDYGRGLHGNRLGYPGTDFDGVKTAGVVRVAALGDSFAVGPVVAFADNFLTQLPGQVAGLEVLNFGVSGAGPREYAMILDQDVWPTQPDLVLVNLFVGNDITETLPTARYLDPRQSALYLLMTRSWRLYREHQQRPAPANPNPRPDGGTLSESTYREVEARRLGICCRKPLAGMERKWQRALDDLNRIVRACRRRSVPLGVVLIPDEFQVDPEVLALALNEAGWKDSEIDLTLPQRRLSAFFAERSVPCLDLLPAFRRAGITGSLYAVRDTHWNAVGNSLAARQIGQWLPAAGLVAPVNATRRRESDPDNRAQIPPLRGAFCLPCW